MTRWQVDNQPPHPAFPHRGQLGGDDLEMPIHRELGLWIEVVEAGRDEGRKVLPQRGFVLVQRQVFNHRTFPLLRLSRAFNCSMTFLSTSEKAAAGGTAASARRSMSCSMSRMSLAPRQSPLAARLTSCVMIALRLVILRRRPFWTTMTRWFSSSRSIVDKHLAPLGRPRGLPD